MVRTIVTPENNQLSFSIPNSYVGKKIEVLYYAVDEVEEDKTPVKENTMARFKGILSAEDANELQQYVKKSREEWDRVLGVPTWHKEIIDQRMTHNAANPNDVTSLEDFIKEMEQDTDEEI